jgi:NADH pyrophosphatase NudC (nudix superfamily)
MDETLKKSRTSRMFIKDCAKRFCPECGKPIEINKIGRPQVLLLVTAAAGRYNS